jgi:hypothetical protein
MPLPRYNDIREPSLRQHENAMERGSADLLAALWKHHPRALRCLTGKMTGL